MTRMIMDDDSKQEILNEISAIRALLTRLQPVSDGGDGQQQQQLHEDTTTSGGGGYNNNNNNNNNRVLVLF